MNDDHTETVTLVKQRFTVTINPTPDDATVTLTSYGETQSGNSIEVNYGSDVLYIVEKAGYETAADGVTNVTENKTIAVTLEEMQQAEPGEQPGG